LAAGLSAGCTVRPLYSDLDPTAAYASGASTSVGAALSEIVIPPVNTRPAQELRNELIFLLGGGQGQPASPRYSLGLTVILLDEASASIQNGTDEEPTAATITMTADYVLTDAATGQQLARGRRQVLASYDVRARNSPRCAPVATPRTGPRASSPISCGSRSPRI
jgi:LPS-assembly lipoprotein